MIDSDYVKLNHPKLFHQASNSGHVRLLQAYGYVYSISQGFPLGRNTVTIKYHSIQKEYSNEQTKTGTTDPDEHSRTN